MPADDPSYICNGPAQHSKIPITPELFTPPAIRTRPSVRRSRPN